MVIGHLVQYTKIPVLRIRIRLNPLHFGQQDPDPGGKMSAKIMENVHKNQPKSYEYHTFYPKILILC